MNQCNHCYCQNTVHKNVPHKECCKCGDRMEASRLVQYPIWYYPNWTYYPLYPSYPSYPVWTCGATVEIENPTVISGQAFGNTLLSN